MVMSRWIQITMNWEPEDSGDLCPPHTGTLILFFPTVTHTKVSMLTPYVSTIKQLQNFRNIFLSWMTVNVTPKPSIRLSHIDECSHTNLGIRLGKPHTMEFSSIYKDFSNVFSGTKYTVDWSGCVCVCVRARERMCLERKWE